MANVPFRGLATKGILRDPSPFSLDLQSWSAGMNVMFQGSKVGRSPVFRTVYDDLPDLPQTCMGIRTSIGYSTVILVANNGRSWVYSNGAITETTPGGYSTSASVYTWTMDILGDVAYMNRPDQVPLYLGPGAANFATLPGWTSTHRANSIRSFQNYLIAVDITKAGLRQSNLVKWSNLALNGLPPDSWDHTDPTKSAGEVPLEQLHTPLVDSCPLRGALVLYAENEVWAMEPVSNNDVFHFRRLFGNGGIIAPNCAVEVNGVHYVFGPNDIYKHDGTSIVSIIDGKNRNALFAAINTAKAQACFVTYLPKLRSILFAFPGTVTGGAFPLTDFCNLGALYSLENDAWSLFVDLPNLGAMAHANVNVALTYATAGVTLTYAAIGGTYFSQEANYDEQVVGVGGTIASQLTAHRLYGYDFLSRGSMSFPVSDEATSDGFVERTGIDLDEMGADLRTYKVIRCVYPQATVYSEQPITVTVGGHLYPGAAVDWETPVSFNATSGYKVDTIGGGRYLAIRYDFPTSADGELASYDLDVVPNGKY